jgi:hypothetical protein
MEGEQNFLLFLPKETRVELTNFWYRDASKDVKNYVLGGGVDFNADTDLQYKTNNPKQEFLNKLQQRLPGAMTNHYSIKNPDLMRLQTLTGKPFSLMPQVAFVDVLDGSGRSSIYSLLHNNAYSNNAQVFQEAQRRIPVEDQLTIVKGFIGSYPNVFFQLNEQHLGKFTRDIENMRDEQDYARLVSRYGVRRNASWFWRLSDKFHARYKDHYPIEAGLFDLNRYENR